MLFEVSGYENVTLNPSDFHNYYKSAILETLKKRLCDNLNSKYGHVIAIRLIDEPDSYKPVIIPNNGTAMFRVYIKAIVDKLINEEITMAKVKFISQETSQIQFTYFSHVVTANLKGNKVSYTKEEKTKVKFEDGDLKGLELTEGSWAHIQILADGSACKLINVDEEPDSDDDEETNSSDEDSEETEIFAQDDENNENSEQY